MFKAILLRTIAIAWIVGGCASMATPSSTTITLEGKSAIADIIRHIVKALASNDYEIKSKDEESGIIQAFRPVRGTFVKPGYGNKVTVAVERGEIKVTAFAAQGMVTASQGPEEIRDEVVKLIRNQK